MNFSSIREARKLAGITQEDLANKLNVNRATISKYESGAIEPSISQLKKIAKILGVDEWIVLVPGIKRAAYIAADTVQSVGLDPEEIMPDVPYEVISTEIEDVKLAEAKRRQNIHAAKFKIGIALNKLNADGQKEAVERVEELTEIPRYAKRFEPITDQEREAMKSANSWDDVYKILTHNPVPADSPVAFPELSDD